MIYAAAIDGSGFVFEASIIASIGHGDQIGILFRCVLEASVRSRTVRMLLMYIRDDARLSQWRQNRLA